MYAQLYTGQSEENRKTRKFHIGNRENKVALEPNQNRKLEPAEPFSQDPGTEIGTGTAGTIFQEPKPEPEPSLSIHLY